MEIVLLISIRTALALVLLTPLIVMADPLPSTFFPFIVGKAIYAHTLTEIAFGLWVVLIVRYPSHRAPKSWLLVIFAVYVVVVLLASVLGVSPQRSFWSTYERMQGFVDLLHWFAFTWVLVSTHRSWGDWRLLLNVNLGIGVVFGLLGLSQHFDKGVLNFLSGTTRLDITLGNPTYVGAYMLVGILIALGFLGYSLVGTPRPATSRTPPRSRRRRRARARGRSSGELGFSAEIWWLTFWYSAIAVGVAILIIGRDWGALIALVVALAALRVADWQGVTGQLWWRLIWVSVAVLDFLVLFMLGEAIEPTVLAVWLVSLRIASAGGVSIETPWRVFWLTAVVLDALILYLSGTRGAVIGLGAGIIAFAAGYAAWGRLRQVRVAALATLATLFGLVLVVGLARNTAPFERLSASSVMVSRIFSTGPDDDSLRGRINSALVGLRGFAARPLLGWGPENFTVAYDRYVTAKIVAGSSTSFDQAHNKLIEELTTKGILGFLGYSAIWGYMFWVVVRRAREQDAQDQVFTLFAGAALAGYFVQNLFLFDTPGTVVWYVVLLGFVAYLETSSQEQAPDAVSTARSGGKEESRWAAAVRLELIRSNVAYAAVVVAAATLVSGAVYFINYRSYDGAATVLESLNQEISWEERLKVFERSIDAFPPLANYPRIVMFNQLTNNFGSLTPKEAILALQATQRELRRGRESEPEEWRIYLAVASLYHKAIPLNPIYATAARQLVDEAKRLAPNRLETIRILVAQHLAEKDFEGAHAAIDEYVKGDSSTAMLFVGLRRTIDAAAKR